MMMDEQCKDRNARCPAVLSFRIAGLWRKEHCAIPHTMEMHAHILSTEQY